jgi:hypothetical protein
MSQGTHSTTTTTKVPSFCQFFYTVFGGHKIDQVGLKCVQDRVDDGGKRQIEEILLKINFCC